MFTTFCFLGGHENILEVITDLARCSSDALKVIQGLKSKVAVSQLEEEVCLEKERNIWRLLYTLYQDRTATQHLMEDDGEYWHAGIIIYGLIKNNY